MERSLNFVERDDDNAERLDEALSNLKVRALDAGFLINTNRLWHQCGYFPPDKNSPAIKVSEIRV